MNATAEANATDRAQELAREHGVDLGSVKGSGAEGRITADDVRAAADVGPETPTSSGRQPWEGDRDQVVHHTRPILSSGSAGADVVELCRLLSKLDYETSVSQGENPFGVLGPSEFAAIRRFQDEHGVREDPSAYPEGERGARNHIGPWTWEALYKAAGEV